MLASRTAVLGMVMWRKGGGTLGSMTKEKSNRQVDIYSGDSSVAVERVSSPAREFQMEPEVFDYL